ncbi:uncharacterized protein [Lepeophtheirus salmonis]|uniref:uncharacterized protein n=1 Tax=Lepeophtheirus salmonis TaxID=72036 RepID=UPI001AE7FE33|nr:endocuticle structural glycoprotein SgAbd-1-like [Lepeophtheirus salmonis]
MTSLVKFIVSSLLLIKVSGLPQIASEIDTYDDLLAIESQFIENEVDPSVQKILPAPPGFNGERFSAPPLSFASRPTQQINNNFAPRPIISNNNLNSNGNNNNGFNPVPQAPILSRPPSNSFNGVTNNNNNINIGKSNDPHSYSFSFETPEMKRDETGRPKGSNSYVQTGGWEYVGDDGRVYSIRFIADENGFRPVGNHLPTPPPLPPALQRFEDARSGRLSRQRSQG